MKVSAVSSFRGARLKKKSATPALKWRAGLGNVRVTIAPYFFTNAFFAPYQLRLIGWLVL
jgi:hypothetical protein